MKGNGVQFVHHSDLGVKHHLRQNKGYPEINFHERRQRTQGGGVIPAVRGRHTTTTHSDLYKAIF